MVNLAKFTIQADFKNHSFTTNFSFQHISNFYYLPLFVAYQTMRLLIVVRRNAIKTIYGHIQIILVMMNLFICLVLFPPVVLLPLHDTWTLALVNIWLGLDPYYAVIKNLLNPRTILLRDNSPHKAIGCGSVLIQSKTGQKLLIHDILYVPRLAMNLISVSQIPTGNTIIIF